MSLVKVKLAEIADVQTGPFGSQLHQSDYVQNGTPIITVEHLGDDRIKRENLPLVNDDDKTRLHKYHLKEGDTVFSRVGSVDRASYVHKEEDGWLFSGRCLRVRPEPKKVDPRYLSFYLRSPQFTSYIKSIAVGATMPSINTSLLETSPVLLVDFVQQQKIGHFLDAIERKIELTRRTNKTLEQIGQSFFRHYFIDNPEREKWQEARLGEYVELVNGASYKSSELTASDCALVTLKSFKRGGGFKRDGFKEFTGKVKDSQVVKDGDLVVAHTDMTQQAEVAGVPALVSGSDVYAKVGISMDIVKVIPKTELVNEGFLYFLMMTREFQAHKMGYIAGTTVLHLNKKCIPEFVFKVPDLKTLSIPSKLFQGIIYKKTSLDNEIVTLEKIRDLVLPKLITGQITI